MRARRWWGVQVGQPEVYLWGAPVELSKTDRIKVIRDRLINQLLLNAFEMSPRQMDEYIEAMEAWRPCSIYGYASSLALLAAHADRRGRRLNLSRLRVVNATGETLYPHQRELIERMFGVPAAVEYGARDAGLIALTSPKGQNLLMSETIILEVLDEAGAPVAHGNVGEAVITNLDSEAQPFIRYRTGDMVRRTQEPCIDGRGLHVLSDIEGRKTDFIVRADGTVMHALALIYVIRNTEGVAQFKCIQHTVRDLEVLVVPDGRWSESSAQAIKAGLRQRLGDDLRIELGICDAIAPEASGKHRYVVSRVVLDDSLQRAVTA
jgi:phenylacetate-CoA ligase